MSVSTQERSCLPLPKCKSVLAVREHILVGIGSQKSKIAEALGECLLREVIRNQQHHLDA